jgi:hypothetical protein
MKAPKKRSLNEIRQTKDVHYIVPKVNRISTGEKALTAYFNIDPNPISKKNMSSFIRFLSSNNYKIIKA